MPALHGWSASRVARKIPLIGELELGFQQSLCLNISITGTNGKTTTTEPVERIAHPREPEDRGRGEHWPAALRGGRAEQGLDFLTLEVSSFQLERTQFFRPAVAVLLNITPDHLDRYASMGEYCRAKARLFHEPAAV